MCCWGRLVIELADAAELKQSCHARSECGAPSNALWATGGQFRLCKLFRGHKIEAKMLNASCAPDDHFFT